MEDNSEALSKITINGQEYDPADVQDLVDAGKKTRELEQKYNTTLDKVWPEYGRSQQLLKERERELEEAKAQVNSFQSKKEEGLETTEDVQKAREAARKLGIPLNEDLEKAGYIRKDDLPGLFQSFQEEQRAIQQVLDKASDLEREIDGNDGRPRFNKKAVLAYAQAYKINDLMEAYDDMNSDQLKSWKDAQVEAQRQKGLKTLGRDGGAKEPKKTRVSDGNFRDILRESLNSGSSEE